MKKTILWIAVLSFCFIQCNQKTGVTKIKMDLNSFGVESDNYPSIHVLIDLAADSSRCKKAYDNPKYKDSAYTLSMTELQQISLLLKHADLEKLKNNYSDNRSDQPTSTVTFYTSSGEITVKDYGLNGEYPLQELYKIAYKF